MINTTNDVKITTPASTLPPMPEQYHKARKQYVFFSAILISWKLAGLKLPEGEKFVVFNNVEITNFQVVVPWVLFALVIYYAFRISVEWKQSNKARRKQDAPRWDFWVSHAIGLGAFGVFIFMNLMDWLKSKTADITILDMTVFIVTGLILPFAVKLIIILLTNKSSVERNRKNYKKLIILCIPAFLGSMWFAMVTIKNPSLFAILTFFVSLLLAGFKILFDELVLSNK